MQIITLEKWRMIHPDYKGYVEGAPYMLINDNGATKSVPVEIDRSKPVKITADKFIGIWTTGMMAENSSTREAVEVAFNEAVKDHEDHFYSVYVDGRKFYIAANGELGFTAMLPDEY